jgi:hypothetical protein
LLKGRIRTGEEFFSVAFSEITTFSERLWRLSMCEKELATCKDLQVGIRV